MKGFYKTPFKTRQDMVVFFLNKSARTTKSEAFAKNGLHMRYV